MTQKVIQVGNSYAVTIPKKIVESLNLDKRGFVDVYEEPEKNRIIVDLAQKEVVDEVLDKEVYQVAKDLLRRYLPAFKKLAKK
ncbi:MAG: AbrB/MazE/SpoVT family DNA-binding domain-containing protein [bacterium]|nr:AbrB/MazE/SpoVT family DNA-binding domain-containing protein [bacterium]